MYLTLQIVPVKIPIILNRLYLNRAHHFLNQAFQNLLDQLETCKHHKQMRVSAVLWKLLC